MTCELRHRSLGKLLSGTGCLAAPTGRRMSGFEAMIEEVRFGEDSPLERTGFELPVPVLQRTLLLAGHPGTPARNRNQLRSGPRPRWLPPGPSQSRFLLGGTTSSNPSSSSAESA